MDIGKELKDTLKYIVLGLVLAIVINFTLGMALGAERPMMAVVSRSMEPTLNVGDLVVIKGVSIDEVKVGDIIVYYNPFSRILVVHRVIDIQEDDGRILLYTKGDNNATNPLPDQNLENPIAPPISEELLRGKVILVIPKVGLVKVWFTELVGKYGFTKVALLVLAIFMLIGMAENYLKRRLS